jgi:hypothetical protein
MSGCGCCPLRWGAAVSFLRTCGPGWWLRYHLLITLHVLRGDANGPGVIPGRFVGIPEVV